MEIEPIAYMSSPFKEKFGIPRQSGLVPEIESRIIFEKNWQDENALRGIEGFSHLWLIWGFSQNTKASQHMLVRPPRLGGNERVGVFATRSPFRPNNLGLSVVKLEKLEKLPACGVTLVVSGADLMDKTPIYDIKPYIAYADAHVEARAGFTENEAPQKLAVKIPSFYEGILGNKLEQVKAALSYDMRPAYHNCKAAQKNSKERVYGFSFAQFNIEFVVKNSVCIVQDVEQV